MSVLSAKAIAAFADAMRMSSRDAVAFVRNANADTRARIADKYESRVHVHEGTSDAEARDLLAVSASHKRDAITIRQALAEGYEIYRTGKPSLGDDKCPDCGWYICQCQERKESA